MRDVSAAAFFLSMPLIRHKVSQLSIALRPYLVAGIKNVALVPL